MQALLMIDTVLPAMSAIAITIVVTGVFIATSLCGRNLPIVNARHHT